MTEDDVYCLSICANGVTDCRPRDCFTENGACGAGGSAIYCTLSPSAVGSALACGIVHAPRQLHGQTATTVRTVNSLETGLYQSSVASEYFALQLRLSCQRAPACGLAAVVHSFTCMTSTSGVLHDVGRLLQQRPVDSHAATRHRVELLRRGP
jgi:predicted outer membrane repeat protein